MRTLELFYVVCCARCAVCAMAGDSKDTGNSAPARSADVVDDHAPATTRGKAHLVVGDAPKKPKFGGKGLDSNAVYEAQSTTGICCLSAVLSASLHRYKQG